MRNVKEEEEEEEAYCPAIHKITYEFASFSSLFLYFLTC
jgi:hypothetical protein